jgi:hypothetical protein
VLGTEALPDDNDPPFPYFDDCYGPFDNRMWWARATGMAATATEPIPGAVYYSPVDRPEALEDLIPLSTTEDPTQKVIAWNAILWVFTKRRVFQIFGRGPYTFRAIDGVPGTSEPFTVMATHKGIVYQANDGVRLFDGRTSTALGFDSVSHLFRATVFASLPVDRREGLSTFVGTTATADQDQYLIGDGQQALSIDLESFAWRDLGLPIKALDHSRSRSRTIASFRAGVHVLEDGAATDSETPIAFDLKSPLFRVDPETPGIVQYVMIDANTEGQVLTPTLYYDDTTVQVLPPFSTTGRQVTEYAINKSARFFGVRLVGDLTAPVEVFGVEVDLWVPERPGVLA